MCQLFPLFILNSQTTCFHAGVFNKTLFLFKKKYPGLRSSAAQHDAAIVCVHWASSQLSMTAVESNIDRVKWLQIASGLFCNIQQRMLLSHQSLVSNKKKVAIRPCPVFDAGRGPCYEGRSDDHVWRFGSHTSQNEALVLLFYFSWTLWREQLPVTPPACISGRPFLHRVSLSPLWKGLPEPLGLSTAVPFQLRMPPLQSV